LRRSSQVVGMTTAMLMWAIFLLDYRRTPPGSNFSPRTTNVAAQGDVLVQQITHGRPGHAPGKRCQYRADAADHIHAHRFVLDI